jgi:epoxyqueuosine reductase QueG
VSQLKPTKTEIIARAKELGAEMVGFSPVSRWDEYADVPTDFRPRSIWPLAKTVISIAVPLWLPAVEAAPSELGREQYIVTNDLLAEAAYRLAVFLNRQGHAAINLPRDGYGEPEVLDGTPGPVFTHLWAAYYGGLGTIGWNNALLTRAYGPRVRLTSVFTELELEGDLVITENYCSKCQLCQKICPAQALTGDKPASRARLNLEACAANGRRLRRAFRNPCGFCIKVCPIGEDRILFKSTDTQKYFDEAAVLAERPYAEEYQSWLHIRKYGGHPLPEDPISIQ